MFVETCKREISHREYLGWLYHLSEEFNNPSKTDYYIMGLSAQVARILAKDPKKIKLSDFKIEFGEVLSKDTSSETLNAKANSQKSALIASLRSTHGQFRKQTTSQS